MQAPDLDSVLSQLVGQSCTQVSNTIGATLLIDFGTLGRGPHQRTDSAPQGWRSLLIDAPWRLDDHERVVCDWNADNTHGGAIDKCVSQLVEQRIVRVNSQPPAWDLVIEFANRMRLSIFSDSTADRVYAWTILGTDGLELEVGPGISAPGWKSTIRD